MFAPVTAIELYRLYLQELEQLYSQGESAEITKLIFESVAGMDKTTLIKNPQETFTPETLSKLIRSLDRLKLHTPVQYITGEAWFYKLKFMVNPSVLVPRPETEELVYEAIAFLNETKRKSVIDIGTGSGCISISIKKNIPETIVTSVDISHDAIETARENARLHQTNIIFNEIDFIDETNWNSLGQYDLIISNPPYIPLSEMGILDKNVTAHEPHTALFVDDDEPLIFYKKIAVFGKSHLEKAGSIMVETHENYAGEVSALFEANGYSARIQNDISGKQRMVMASRSR